MRELGLGFGQSFACAQKLACSPAAVLDAIVANAAGACARHVPLPSCDPCAACDRECDSSQTGVVSVDAVEEFLTSNALAWTAGAVGRLARDLAEVNGPLHLAARFRSVLSDAGDEIPVVTARSGCRVTTAARCVWPPF